MLWFCEKFVLKKETVKYMKLTSSDDELVKMFLNKQRKKQRFWLHPVLTRGHHQTMRILSEEAKK